MRAISRIFQHFRRNGDWVLLFLCLLTTCFGCVIVASASNHFGSSRYLVVQIAATLLGLMCYILLTYLRVDAIAERREVLFFVGVFLILLLVPFGYDGGTGNKSWLKLPGVPVNIQPAEICKIIFVLLLARVMQANQNNISSFKSVFSMAFYLVALVGLNMVISHDAGVSLIFVFIFIVMAFVGGVKVWWFLCGIGGLAMLAPYIWNNLMQDYQKLRLEAIWNPDVDPLGTGVRWHTMHSLRSLSGGGLSGQGLFQGARTQVGALQAQHTDFIFSAIGEELGLLGCAFTLLLLALVVFRILYVGLRTRDYLGRMVCIGIAGSIIFQILINVGMCLGVMPVIGLTLPFISYGGSSIVSMYLAVGVVSSVYAHPDGDSKSRYISPRM